MVVRFFRFAPLFALALLAGCNKLDSAFGGGTSACGTLTAYAPGTSLTGSTSSGTCRGSNARTGKFYAMTVSQQSGMTLTVTTSAFEPYIGLYASDDKVVAEGGINGKMKVFLAPGSYKLLVTSNDGKNGDYTLSSPTLTLGGTCSSSTGGMSDSEIGITMRGADVAGTINATDCGALNAKTHWYQFHVVTNDTVNVTLGADKAAGFYVLNTTGAIIATKEVAAGGSWTTKQVAGDNGWFAVHVEARATAAQGGVPLKYTLGVH